MKFNLKSTRSHLAARLGSACKRIKNTFNKLNDAFEYRYESPPVDKSLYYNTERDRELGIK